MPTVPQASSGFVASKPTQPQPSPELMLIAGVEMEKMGRLLRPEPKATAGWLKGQEKEFEDINNDVTDKGLEWADAIEMGERDDNFDLDISHRKPKR